MSGLEVTNDGLNLVDDTLGIGNAGLDLGEVVVTNHAFEETSKEEEGSIEGHVSNGGLDGANGEGKGISSVDTSLEVVTGGPVGLLGSEVSLDLSSVEDPVFGDGAGESGGLGEDLGPGLNGGDVLIHTLAGGHGGANLVPDDTSILDSLEEVTGLEFTDGDLGVRDDLLSTLEAGLNFGEVVVTSHSVHETGDPVGDSHGVEGGGGSSNSSGSESSHSSSLFCCLLL